MQPGWPGEFEQFLHNEIDAVELSGDDAVELLEKTVVMMLATDKLGKGTNRGERVFNLWSTTQRSLPGDPVTLPCAMPGERAGRPDA